MTNGARPRAIAAVALLGLGALGGCGEDEPAAPSAPTSTTTTSTTETKSTPDEPSETPPSAHIQPLSGSVNGLRPDGREGTAPPTGHGGELARAAKAAGCDLRLHLKDEGNTHIEPTDPPPDYGTNPPTSGDHVAPPFQQADGAYLDPPEPIATVHSLEHGRVTMQYSPQLGESEQLELKGLFEHDPDGMLLYPNAEMPYEVAATAWTQLLGCESYEGTPTLNAVRAFRETFLGQGPEDVPVDLG